MKILDLTTDMIIDFTGSAKLADETLEFVDNRGVRYRRDDEVLVSSRGVKFKAVFGFRLDRLTDAEKDILEKAYRDRENFICVPDVEDKPDEAFVMRWASDFEWTDTTPTNWGQGKTIQGEFREI